MELTFDQSLFLRTSAVNIQNCPRAELETLFIEMLRLKLYQENMFKAIITDKISKEIDYTSNSKTSSSWSESFLQF